MKVSEGRGGRLKAETLTAMITDAAVLARVAPRWKRPMFGADWCDEVGEWCVNHYRKFQEAPGPALPKLFDRWAERQRDGSPVVEEVGQFLAQLSQAHEQNGKPASAATSLHALEQAAECFDRAALEKLAADVNAALQIGDVEAARRAAAFRPVPLAATADTFPFGDDEAVEDIFTEEPKNLFEFGLPGLDFFFAHQLAPNSFVCFMAPNKSTKSFWLMEVAYRAMCQRRKVAYYVVGDMSRRQVMRRLVVRAAGRPLRGPFPRTVKSPTALRKPPKGQPGLAGEAEWEEEVFEEALARDEAIRAMRRVQKRCVRSDEPYLCLQCHPAKSVTVDDLRADLDAKAARGFVADVVVVDYADNLGALDRRADRRDQVNDTWVALSALRQERHCLLLTASQADSESFRKGLLDRHNFSEDRRKLDHVTAMVGINITPEEKEKDLCRLNLINARESPLSHTQVVYVAGCLDLCNPAVLSCF